MHTPKLGLRQSRMGKFPARTMRPPIPRFAPGALLVTLLLAPGCPGAEEPQRAADMEARPCLTLSDGGGNRIATGMGGKTIATSTGRPCPAPKQPASPTTDSEPMSPPMPSLQSQSAEPAATSPVRPLVHRRSPRVEPAPVPVVRPEPARHFDTGAVQLDADRDRAPQATPPLALKITPARITATVITGGAMMLLLHSGLWTSLLILGLPLWRHVDLLPIVDGAAATGPIGTTGKRAAPAEPELAPVLDRAPRSKPHDQASP